MKAKPHVRRRNLVRITLLVAATSILGCLEEKSEYTINPDLSGKTTVELIFVPDSFAPMAPGDAPEQVLRPHIEEILRRSKGIDTWKDISFELTDEGSVRFTGTAYFPDINKMSIWRPEFREGTRLKFTKDPSGRITIESPDSGTAESSVEKEDGTELSDAELIRELKLARLRYNQAKPMLQMTLGNLKQDMLIHLPARIEKISVFEKTDDSTAHWRIDGNEVIEALEKLVADEEQLKRLIREGKNPFGDTPDESVFNELFLGKKGRIQVISDADPRDLFDYETEVAAARGEYDRMLEELGLDLTVVKRPDAPVVSRAPAKPGTIEVVGVNLVRYHDEEREIRPLNRGAGYTLSLMLELDEPHLAITHGRVDKAITDTGQNILRARTKISSPKLSKDGRAVVFDFALDAPDKAARGLAELSGVLVYLGSSGTKEIDLGVMDFKDGAESGVPGFSIRSIRDDWQKGYTRLELKVNLLLGALKSTRFYREDGTELDLSDEDDLSKGTISFYAQDGTELNVSQSGKSFSGDRLMNVHYRIKGEFPPRGRIVLEVLDNVTKHEISFKLTNISLIGDPL